ncbi:apolipoprotein N-acyltransferase [Geodermatophilus bullaregiensis]|uniref:nitrilase-related carbon-nitrogen hydrolase n=1 Tax=Geodermatophilus bullaregiensis TaxID=1564160 RepID=UPI00195B33F0|nr:nitrilase-related carbon-nitrogen hydrolase [Geodermatophilus bullaregiensis]MBM7807907.1 apolipoprotein N-acyltransferase [Geodermatophilus bullaregiensis]
MATISGDPIARRTGEADLRRPRRVPPPHPVSRWPWLWLVVGAALLPFAGLQTLVPLTAWVAPVFLMRFTRSRRPVVGLPVLVVAISLALLVGLRGGFFPVEDGIGYYVFVAGLGLGGALPFAVDRLLAPRLTGLSRTLVFPAAVTTVEFLSTFVSAYGTAGSAAYSQYAGLPLVQLVSVTGIWGLTFLVSWLAPVVNQLWERGWSAPGGRTPTVLFAAVLAAALLFGGAQLAFAAPAAETVRVAALAPDRRLSELAYSAPAVPPGDAAGRAAVRDEYFRPVLDELFARSEREAVAGAEVIAWSEAAARTLEEDQAAVVSRAADVARRHGVYLQVSMIVQLASGTGSDGGPVNENHAVLLDPDGTVVWDYLKSRPVPGDGHDPGPGVVPTVDTPHGRLATIICQDDFFPGLVRQAGRAGVDILLVPSSDWRGIAAWHAQQAPFRAVENGVALVRPTRQGISLATDGQGRLLGHKADYDLASDQTLVVSVPTQGNDTWYARMGDTVAFASALGLLALTGAAWRSRRRPGGDAGTARTGSDQAERPAPVDGLPAR